MIEYPEEACCVHHGDNGARYPLSMASTSFFQA